MSKILTISIAAYNVEPFIRKTLDSLIDESIIDDLEIFVVDDGGTDRTLDIAKEYAKKYPKSVFPVHKENGGYGSTINKSIELANGKYFKQLDGDDWYLTENLKILIDTLRDVSVDCVFTDFIRFYENNNISRYMDVYPNIKEGEYRLSDSGIKNRMRMYSSIFRTDLLKNMPERLTEHCFYTDDEYSAFPVPYIDSVFVLHKAIYVYRIRGKGQSMTVDGIAAHYQEHEYVFWKLYSVYNKIPQEEKVNRLIFFDQLIAKIREHYRFLCLLPSYSSAKNEIIKFNKKAHKECPDVLMSAMEKFKWIKLLDYDKSYFDFTVRFFVELQWKLRSSRINVIFLNLLKFKEKILGRK